LQQVGLHVTRTKVRVARTGITLAATAADADGRVWPVDVSGAFTIEPSGLARVETVWRAIGRAAVLAGRGHRPVVHLTSHLPERGSEPHAALAAAPAQLFGVVARAGADDAEAALKQLLADVR